jgi:hypothetical protein
VSEWDLGNGVLCECLLTTALPDSGREVYEDRETPPHFRSLLHCLVSEHLLPPSLSACLHTGAHLWLQV